jgi:hypothetical protein
VKPEMIGWIRDNMQKNSANDNGYNEKMNELTSLIGLGKENTLLHSFLEDKELHDVLAHFSSLLNLATLPPNASLQMLLKLLEKRFYSLIIFLFFIFYIFFIFIFYICFFLFFIKNYFLSFFLKF